jgi:hypothetical protein
VFVECILCFGELEEASSSSSSSYSSSSSSEWAPFNLEASLVIKKMKEACIESFRHVDTLGSQTHGSHGGCNVTKLIKIIKN